MVVAGRLLGARLRRLPSFAEGRVAVERRPVPRPNVGPVGRPRRGLPRRPATGKTLEPGLARHGSALVGVVGRLR